MAEVQPISGYHVCRYNGQEVKIRISAKTGQEIPEDIPQDMPFDAVCESVPVETKTPAASPEMLAAYQRIISRDPDFIPSKEIMDNFASWTSASSWVQSSDFSTTDVIAFGESHGSIVTKALLIQQLLPELKAKGFEYFVTELFPSSIQPEIDEFIKSGTVGTKMTYWLGEQENIAPGLSRAYESLLDKARELGFKIITAAPNITYDAEEMFYRKLNEVMPGRVADYNKKYGFNPSMEVGEQWAAEIMEQVQVEYLKRIIKDTDSSIAQALESIPHNKKAVLLTGSNHIIRDGGAPLLKLSRKKITTVMVFDAPIAMRDGLVGQDWNLPAYCSKLKNNSRER